VGSRTSPSFRRCGDDREDVGGPNEDALILWRVDPTGQFWRTDASGIGRGGSHAELELLRRVRDWMVEKERARSTTTKIMTTTTTTTVGEERHGNENVERRRLKVGDGANDDEFEVNNSDVRAYLGTLTPNEALEVATDCLVNGILARRGGRRRRRRRDALHDEHDDRHEDNEERRRLAYELDLRRRVRAVIIQS
jgi:hypothetical protein